MKRPKNFRITDYPMYYMATIRHRNSANLANVLRPHGVTPAGWRVLAILQERDGHNIGYLAEISAVERSNMSRIVDSMEKAGLVKRAAQKGDKRQRLVYLTAAGRRKFDTILPLVLERYAKNFEGLSDRDMQTLMTFLRRIKDNVFHSPIG
jgi:DNA-binding MarR family transcriptional regulator